MYIGICNHTAGELCIMYIGICNHTARELCIMYYMFMELRIKTALLSIKTVELIIMLKPRFKCNLILICIIPHGYNDVNYENNGFKFENDGININLHYYVIKRGIYIKTAVLNVKTT